MNDMIPPPEVVESVMRSILVEEVACTRHKRGLQLDTPFTLPNGAVLRVYIEQMVNGGLRVAEGKYTLDQFTMHLRSSATVRQHIEQCRHIAHTLDLLWEGEFSYQADSLEDALRRLPILSMAIGQAISTLRSPSVGRTVGFRTQLEQDLLAARLVILPNNTITLKDGTPVRVDLRVAYTRTEAAIHTLSARGEQSATNAVNRAVTHLTLLTKDEYPGVLAVMLDPQSPAAQPRLRTILRTALPERAVLLQGPKAAAELAALMAA